jgi:hypothetical protein
MTDPFGKAKAEKDKKQKEAIDELYGGKGKTASSSILNHPN